MDDYKLMISAAAESDIEGIADYIAVNLREPGIALKQVGRIKDAIVFLREMPERHHVVTDKYLSSKGIRMLTVDNYIIFYVVNKEAGTVSIVRVLYAKREWQTLL